MPHDKNGKLLKPGDKVSVEFTVTAVYPGADMCNISLARSVEGEQSLSLTCQAKQCDLVEAAPEPVTSDQGDGASGGEESRKQVIQEEPVSQG